MFYRVLNRPQDFLQMMGINPWLNYLAWFLVTLMAMTASSIILAVVTMIPLARNGPVMRNSSFSVVLLLLVAFSAGTINFSFFVGSLFNKGTQIPAFRKSFITRSSDIAAFILNYLPRLQ